MAAEEARLLRQARVHSELPQDADDAFGDACVSFLRRYDGPATVPDALPWMLITVRRAAWDISKRRRAREYPAKAFGTQTEQDGDGPDPAEAFERADDVARMAEALAKLAKQERDALILFGLGYSYEEIATLRGWSGAKVNKLISVGRAQVRQFLRKGSKSS